MPRITYHDRFAALLAKDYVSDRDRSFAESLYSHYKRKGALTAGRRRCFIEMEERYAVRPEPAPGAPELDMVLARIQASEGGNNWDYTFVSSVQTQLKGGRKLSERQTEILDKIKAKYSDEAMNARDRWANSWDAEKAEIYRIACTYYGRGSYFARQVRAYRENPDVPPSMDDYKRLTDNKFAKKVLAGWFSEPKFPVGSMVALGSGASYAHARACPSSHNLCVVVSVNVEVPHAAARGNKIYRVLPVGAAQTFNIEERALKRGRVPKKKR